MPQRLPSSCSGNDEDISAMVQLLQPHSEYDREDSGGKIMQVTSSARINQEDDVPISHLLPLDGKYDNDNDEISVESTKAAFSTSGDNEGTDFQLDSPFSDSSSDRDSNHSSDRDSGYNSGVSGSMTIPDTSDDSNEGYDSDESCASDDSFTSNIFKSKSTLDTQYPKYRRPEYHTLIVEDVKLKPSPAVTSKGQPATSYSRLECLPAELRRQILLSIPDLPSLRSIVRASPTIHEQYRLDRHKILSACLARELDGFYVDAYANLKSRVCELKTRRTDAMVFDFFSTYDEWLTHSEACPDIKALSPSCVRWMAAYHISVARPLARGYSHWALANLKCSALLSTAEEESADVASHTVYDMELSRSEEIRIFRALYRFETFHHLFGQNHGLRWGGGCMAEEICELFFSLFDAWEGEAVGCIDTYVRQMYEGIFDKIQWDLSPENPKYINPGCAPADLYRGRHRWLDGTVTRGLKLVARLLAVEDYEELVNRMCRCLTYGPGRDATLDSCLEITNQSDRRDFYGSLDARDEAEQRRDPTPFVGDSIPPSGPPLAWVLLWGGKYANLYGKFVPESLRLGGYVMWDERRLANREAKEFIVSQWDPKNISFIKNVFGWSPLDG